MRGETFLHMTAILLLCLYALDIVVHFGGYVIIYDDLLIVTTLSYFTGVFVVLITEMKATGYRGRELGYYEEQVYKNLLFSFSEGR